MDSHKVTAVQLTQFYLHRIKKLDGMLNAVITVSPTALAEARAADKARRARRTIAHCLGSRSS